MPGFIAAYRGHSFTMNGYDEVNVTAIMTVNGDIAYFWYVLAGSHVLTLGNEIALHGTSARYAPTARIGIT